MDSWLGSVKELLDIKKLANVSVPGLCVAVVLVLIFWPPKPVNVIPVVQSAPLGIAVPYSNILGKSVRNNAPLSLQPKTSDPACSVAEYYLEDLPAPYQYATAAYKKAAKDRQYLLEQESRYLDVCLARQKRLAGEEQSKVSALQHDLQALDATRLTRATLVADYERSGSPLLPAARSRLQATNRSIADKHTRIQTLEQFARDREWEVAELTRWKGLVAEHLTEPGKLRPEQGLDDYLQALSGHILAFLTLSITVGLLLDSVATPLLSRAFYAFVFRR